MIEDDEDIRMTGGSAGSADTGPKGAPAVPVKRRPALKVPPSTRPKAVPQGSTSCGEVCCSERTNCGAYL